MGPGFRRGDGYYRLPGGQITSTFPIPISFTCPALARKIFAFRFSENNDLTSPIPHRHEGRTRRHERGAECGGRVDAVRRAASARTAKACGPGAPKARRSSPSEAHKLRA